MNIIDVITKKRDGKDLSKADIDFFITAMMNEKIADYHVSALLMACYINGLTDDETFFLTNALLKSGETLKFNDKPYFSRMVDKHSTGGIGDKTTLIVIPMVASLGVKCAKQSGRGLGFTGGTADKLMSIPGFNTNLSSDKFLEAVEKVGAALITQTADISPADKKLYALRDSTATADNTSLIASSIMSKKLASGCNNILLDVKCGSGAFAGEFEDAKKLANLMVKIGGNAGKNMMAMITDMSEPLGDAVGNAIEVIEAYEVLNGKKGRLYDLCVHLAAGMLVLAHIEDDFDRALKIAAKSIDNKEALKKFYEILAFQGVKSPETVISKLGHSKYSLDVTSKKDGYVKSIDARGIGRIACICGAGRIKKDDEIDYGAGIIMHCKVGDYIKKGDKLFTVYFESDKKVTEGDIDDDIIVLGDTLAGGSELIKEIIVC